MERATRTGARACGIVFVGLVVASCSFDPAYRDVAQALKATCEPGEIACRGDELSRCDEGPTGPSWTAIERCKESGQICAQTLLRCAACQPKSTRCDNGDVVECSREGTGFAYKESCDHDHGLACRDGACQDLCTLAETEKSNVGCEYWAVDLDNAVPAPNLNAAQQPFAVVVSNAETDAPAVVTIEVDDATGTDPPKLRTVATATVAPGSLEVFYLGSREVDGSPPGQFNTGTNTARTRNAFRVKSTFPIVAYQFNPLENVGVFSNDASQLLPTSALNGPYVIASWPQTIATTDNPDTNFDTDLRAFLTLVGTRENTHVRVKSMARIVPGPPLPNGVAAGETFDVTLQPFEILNVETGDFGADFTGSLVEADQPLVVFAGSEASDAPLFDTLPRRLCCADHLEAQAIPTRAAGKTFVVSHMPNRLDAVIRAGAPLQPAAESEVYRIVATQPTVTKIKTTLPPPDDSFDLNGEGDYRTIQSLHDFTLTASQGVILADIQVGQEGAGIPRGYPGGDPSLSYVPPIEQWRSDYVLLLPDKYVFDFLVFSVPDGAKVFLDGAELGPDTCEIGAGDGLTAEKRKSPRPPFWSYRCPMSFPVISTTPQGTPKIDPGRQNDGVHRIQADKPVGVVVYGFDSFVSYAYAGGTQLREINPR